MNRKVLSVALSLLASMLLAATGFAAERAATHRTPTRPIAARQLQTNKEHKEAVTLAIAGAEDRQSAELLSKALQQQGLRVTVREQKNQPYELTTTIEAKMDLSAPGKAIQSVATPQKSAFPPSLDLVLFAPLTKENAKQAIDQLRHLKGVDAQNSHANVSKGELWVRINGASRVTPDDIHNAVRAAGIDARFMKQGVKSS